MMMKQKQMTDMKADRKKNMQQKKTSRITQRQRNGEHYKLQAYKWRRERKQSAHTLTHITFEPFQV